MPEADARRRNVDLDGLRLAGLWIELHVGEAGTGDDQRVAFLHRVLRRRGPEQADSAGRVRVVVGDDRLPKQGLDDRSLDRLCQPQYFLAGSETAATREDDDLRPGIDQVGRGL